MSGNKWGVSPKLPVTITGTSPIVVTKSGLSYNISYGAGGSVTRRQWFLAVAQIYDMSTLLTAVNADPSDPVWAQFNAGTVVLPGDVLADFTQTTFGLNDVQMQQLFAVAITKDF